MSNNARKKKKTKYQGSGKSLRRKYPTRGYSDSAKDSSKKGKVYSVYITDIPSRDDFYAVAAVIREITECKSMDAEAKAQRAYSGISTLIVSSADKSQVEDWKRKLERARAKVKVEVKE